MQAPATGRAQTERNNMTTFRDIASIARNSKRSIEDRLGDLKFLGVRPDCCEGVIKRMYSLTIEEINSPNEYYQTEYIKIITRKD